MIITIKKLEILFIIVYLLTASICIIFSLGCFISTTAATAVGLGDWYLLKFMAKRWLKKGRYSFIDSAFRFILVAVSILLLLRLNLNRIGIVVGISVVPLSLMITAVIAAFSKKTTL